MICDDEDEEHPNNRPVTLQDEHEWLSKQDLSKFKGEWIAVYGMEIVAHHKSLAELTRLIREVVKLPSDMLPLYMLIPEGFITLSAACLDCFFDRPNEADCATCTKKGKT